MSAHSLVHYLAAIDLVIDFGTIALWAVEIKRSTAPTITKGFHIACEDLKPTRKYAVYGGNERFPMSGGIQIIGLTEIMHEIAKRR